MRRSFFWLSLSILSLLFSACRGAPTLSSPKTLHVLAVENFLADIAQNVAGDRLKVEALMPPGLDPHSFEPAPADAAKVADSQVIIVNGAGLETFLDKLLNNAGGQHTLIQASAGLKSRIPSAQEALDPAELSQGDPHFWLDPNNVIHYTENIRQGLSQADPQGAQTYARNAAAYTAQLKDLDTWIHSQVDSLPAEKRLLVTNHESFGYFADRYGFRIVGTLIPNVSPDASPSAQELATLVDRIRLSGVHAIFLETGSNPQLASQVAHETGIQVVSGLYTHSIGLPGSPAPTYIDMIRYDTQAIVGALK